MKTWLNRGGITLYEGDAFDILPLIDERAALVLTDPPYTLQTHQGARTNKKGVDGSQVDFDSFTQEDLLHAFDVIADVADAWVVATIDWQHQLLLKRSYTWDQRGPLPKLRYVRFGIWCKTNPTPQKSGDRPAQGFESIAILHRELDSGRMQWNGGGHAGVWHSPVARNTIHPTQKPEKLISDLIQAFTNPGDLVIDPFCGSGVVLRMAKMLQRRAIGIERNPRYLPKILEMVAQESLPLLGKAP